MTKSIEGGNIIDDITNRPPAGLIRELRQLIPLRPLTLHEAYELAERQATATLRLLHIGQPAVPLRWILDLPKVEVRLEPRYRMTRLAGMTTWRNGRYLTIINRNDPHGRRRYTLAHELKHILDYTLVDTVYSQLGYGKEAQQARCIEQIADHFAACLLMPRTWLKQSWATGIQDVESLAGLFNVTGRAMTVRLTYLGFIDDGRPAKTYFRKQCFFRQLFCGVGQ